MTLKIEAPVSSSPPLFPGAQSFLPAVWLRASFLRGQTHCYGDDEGHLGHSVVSLHSVSSSRLHRQHHQADQQPVTAACGGRAQPDHVLYPSKGTTPNQSSLKHRDAVTFWSTTAVLNMLKELDL